jgi:large subunit ribosomal protein L32
MAVPKSKPTKQMRGNRRSHNALTKTNPNEDQTTGELKRPHHVSVDGHYRGRKVTTRKVKH